MKSRRKAREAALQALYQCDTLSDWSVSAVELFFQNFYPSSPPGPGDSSAAEIEPEHELKDFAKHLVLGVIEQKIAVDGVIAQSSTNWTLSRMARVDRNILRVAAYELLFQPDVPVNVVINEAIEVAKSFGTDETPQFVNGVLDNVAKLIASQAKSRM